MHAALRAWDEAGEEDVAGSRGRDRDGDKDRDRYRDGDREAHEHTRCYRTTDEKAKRPPELVPAAAGASVSMFFIFGHWLSVKSFAK